MVKDGDKFLEWMRTYQHASDTVVGGVWLNQTALYEDFYTSDIIYWSEWLSCNLN